MKQCHYSSGYYKFHVTANKPSVEEQTITEHQFRFVFFNYFSILEMFQLYIRALLQFYIQSTGVSGGNMQKEVLKGFKHVKLRAQEETLILQ